MEVTIDKNVEIPPCAGRMPSPIQFPLGDLEVGDSFYIRCQTLKEMQKHRSTLQNDVRKFRNIPGNKKFSISTRSDNEGFRVWRIS